jgi:DNA-binding NtrC family response regulator
MNEVQLSELIIGESAAIRRLRAIIVRLAPSNTCVSIQGPTGSGKELVAQALHAASGRRGRLVAVNVCAIPESMFEATLFGHVRGAFTGALNDSAGLLAEADRGTLFLDEIGSLGLAEQAKLLRVLETGVFRPMGASRDRCSAFRLVSATNENLEQLVHQRRFRSDLWYRLRGTPIAVPPLAERREDIAPLVHHFVRRADPRVTLTRAALRVLQEHAWPGNVRELRQAIESAAALSEHGVIATDELLRVLTTFPERSLERPIREEHRQELLDLLVTCGWDTARVAQRLGVHRATIYRRIERLGIRLPRPQRGVLLEVF